MDARIARAALVAVVALTSMGASYRTQNFVVTAPNAQIAKQVGDSAERFRRDLAVEWLGEPMPAWSQPCPIQVQVGERMGAGGATSFIFDHGEVFGWQMSIQGSLERVLDSVLPHEVTHTVFATHFRRPLPRWADEGACTTVEHPSERNKQQQMLIQFLKTGRGIPFSAMFAMKEYPSDVLPLYAQGHSLAGFLIHQGGKRKFLQFVRDGLEDENWTQVLSAHYGYSDLRVLQDSWLDWVAKGSPPLRSTEPTTIAAVTATQPIAPQMNPSVAPQAVMPTATNMPYPQSGPVGAPAVMPVAAQLAAAPIVAASTTPPLANDLNRWVDAERSKARRPRPQPNLVHQEAAVAKTIPSDGPPQFAGRNGSTSPAGTIGAGELVPVEFPTAPPSNVAAVSDPFVTPASATAAVAAPEAQRTGSSRPQMPQSAGQIVLEWTKPVAAPTVLPGAYSSGIATPAAPPGVILDAGNGTTMRR